MGHFKGTTLSHNTHSSLSIEVNPLIYNCVRMYLHSVNAQDSNILLVVTGGKYQLLLKIGDTGPLIIAPYFRPFVVFC